jgi:hypothetical protein
VGLSLIASPRRDEECSSCFRRGSAEKPLLTYELRTVRTNDALLRTQTICVSCLEKLDIQIAPLVPRQIYREYKALRDEVMRLSGYTNVWQSHSDGTWFVERMEGQPHPYMKVASLETALKQALCVS